MLRIADMWQLKALMFFVYLFFWIFEPLPVSSPVAEAGRRIVVKEGFRLRRFVSCWRSSNRIF